MQTLHVFSRQCIAKGDIVVVEDNFGIRITEIISQGRVYNG